MDCYEIWCDLKDSASDLRFTDDLAAYMGYLRERDLIEGYRLTRRKLGFAPTVQVVRGASAIMQWKREADRFRPSRV